MLPDLHGTSRRIGELHLIGRMLWKRFCSVCVVAAESGAGRLVQRAR